MTVINEDRAKPQPLSNQIRYLSTSAILFGNIAFGCAATALPPVLDNMAWKFKTSIADISIVFTLATSMICTGALICGFLSKYVNRQLIAIVSLFAMASVMFVVPYCPTKILFFFCGALLGLSCGFYGSSDMVWMIEIWQERSGPLIQTQSFCSSFGAIIPSIVSAPFLSKNDHSEATDSASTEQSTIYIPFLFIGTLNSIAFLYQLFLYTFYRYHKPPMYAPVNTEPVVDSVVENVALKQQEPVCDNVKGGISKRKIQLVAFAMLFVGAFEAMQISTMQFLPIFGQYSDLKLSESAAAHVLTGLMLTFAAGRLLGILVIFKVRPELIIIGNLILIAIGNMILSVWASGSETMFWIGSMILGAGFSTMLPSFFAFIEKHLIISGVFASCTMVLGTSISATYPIILGKIIEHQAVVLTYTNYGSTFVCVIMMVWGLKLTRKTLARE